MKVRHSTKHRQFAILLPVLIKLSLKSRPCWLNNMICNLNVESVGSLNFPIVSNVLPSQSKSEHSRAQDLFGWAGQCREDNNPLPVPDERGGPHLSNHRQQRGGGRLEQHSLHHVGPWWTGVAEDGLEHLLLQHRVHIAGGGQHG